MLDAKRSKSLIYKENSKRKVLKDFKDSEDLGLTYPQIQRSHECPASVAIVFGVGPICRFRAKGKSEHTMRTRLVLEVT